MIVTQQYQGGDLVISRRQLERLGVAVGDVVEIGKAGTQELPDKLAKQADLQQLLQMWQAEWADVDWVLFEEQRGAM